MRAAICCCPLGRGIRTGPLGAGAPRGFGPPVAAGRRGGGRRPGGGEHEHTGRRKPTGVLRPDRRLPSRAAAVVHPNGCVPDRLVRETGARPSGHPWSAAMFAPPFRISSRAGAGGPDDSGEPPRGRTRGRRHGRRPAPARRDGGPGGSGGPDGCGGTGEGGGGCPRPAGARSEGDGKPADDGETGRDGEARGAWKGLGVGSRTAEPTVPATPPPLPLLLPSLRPPTHRRRRSGSRAVGGTRLSRRGRGADVCPERGVRCLGAHVLPQRHGAGTRRVSDPHGPGGRTVHVRCAVPAQDEPGTCETPRERGAGAVTAYAAVVEFAGAGEGGSTPLLLRAGSNTVDREGS